MDYGELRFHTRTVVKMAMAEFLGTFLLFYISINSMHTTTAVLYVFDVSMSFGMMLAAMVCASGHISGGHFNPMVTLSFLVVQRIPVRVASYYIMLQSMAAILAVRCHTWILPTYKWKDYVRPVIRLGDDDTSMMTECFVEALCTFVLVFVYLTLNFYQVSWPPSALIIGFTHAGCTMFAFDITGCHMNPARSLALALEYRYWNRHWIYWLGPLIGALTAAFVHEFMVSDEMFALKMLEMENERV